MPRIFGRTTAICFKPSRLGVMTLCSLVIIGFAARAEPQQYEIDPEHLTLGFLVEHLGYAKVLGSFQEASGSYQFDEDTGQLSDVLIVVDTASIFTNHRRRDTHLRSADFLNVRQFPSMTFSGVTARPIDEMTFEVEGELELLGLIRPLSLTVSWNKSGAYPFGDEQYVMGISARGSFQRSSYGMNYGVENGWVGDTVEIIIEFEARRH